MRSNNFVNPDDQVRVSCARLLSVPESASVEEASCEFLRGLAGDDYVPSSGKVHALNVWCGTSVAVERDEEVRGREREELTAFAGFYWGLPPLVRRASWEKLCVRIRDSAYLRELERGLDVVVIQLDDADANELACVFRELFVLPRRERAIRRAQWLAENANMQQRWGIALKTLQRKYPTVPILDTRLNEFISQKYDLLALQHGVTEVRPGTALLATVRNLATIQISNSPQARPANLHGFRNAPTESRDAEKANLALVTMLGIIFCVAVFFGAHCAHNSPFRQSSDGVNEQNDQKLPGRTPTRSEGDGISFSKNEWFSFWNYENDVKRNSQSSPPPRYMEWIRAGRPDPSEALRP